ncbi:hypothetical protein LZ017_14600 [Pelomonas sp. CA6]|uniref:hypothetical protein n=1 Tax=Pelomonas sp. CA6 TaxID=2907999 RepID=UPI001F4C3E42|nr:hypothetical protein [Pelomonas sp. CA6]MCH7344608.1 hypothetical protein [Pelomonas sp. CA6]
MPPLSLWQRWTARARRHGLQDEALGLESALPWLLAETPLPEALPVSPPPGKA